MSSVPEGWDHPELAMIGTHASASDESADDMFDESDSPQDKNSVGEAEDVIDTDQGPESVLVFTARSETMKKDEKELEKVSEAGSNLEEKKMADLINRVSVNKGFYGEILNEAAAEELSDTSGGYIQLAVIYNKEYRSKVNCLEDGTLKPRRGVPIIYEQDFFKSLACRKGKWIYQGQLNGWPALTNLELVSLQYWYDTPGGTVSKQFWSNQQFKKYYETELVKFGGDHTKVTIDPKNKPTFPVAGYSFFKRKPTSVRAKFRAPKYTEMGYSKDNPGFVFWYRPFREAPGGPRVAHGVNILKAVRNDAKATKKELPRAVKAHFYGHRYAKAKEGPKDVYSYHAGVLLEWDHGKFCTNVELAWIFGVGGYNGRSNWVEDKLAKTPLFYSCMSDSLKAPWNGSFNEIRMYDMNVKNVAEFVTYLKNYTGKTKQDRFIDPSIKYSHDIRMSFNREDEIVKAVLNYQMRDRRYNEANYNCQTFAADFFAFLCAKIDVEPFSPIRLLYRPRRHYFLYEPEMFEKKTYMQRRYKKKKQKKDQAELMKKNDDLALETESPRNLRGKMSAFLPNLF